LEDSQGSSSLSNWQEQHVDEEECGALVEWYWQGRTEVRGVETHPVHFVDHETYTDWLGSNPGLQGRRITALTSGRAEL
jgi:aromatic ring-cleaving dioxygenase